MNSPVSPAWKKKGSVTPLSTGSDRASLKYHSGLPESSRPTCTYRQKINTIIQQKDNIVYVTFQQALFSLTFLVSAL